MPREYSVYIETKRAKSPKAKNRYYPVVENLNTRKRTYYTGYTVKQSAIAHKRRLEESIANGTYGQEDPTFEEWYNGWIVAKKRSLKRSTCVSYEHSFRRHILPHFQKMRLSEIRPRTIQNWVNDLSENSGLAPATVRRLYRYLRACLRQAQAQEAMHNDPFKGISLPQLEKPAMVFLDEDEILRLIEVAEEPEKTLFAVLAYTGLRLGEGLALAWKHIHFGGNKLTVERSYSYHGGFHSPKTYKSRRSFEMLPVAKERLTLFYKEQGSPPPEALLFSHDLGKREKPLDFSNVRRDFNTALRKAGLKKVTIQSLRHTFASVMLDSGTSIKVLSNCLGHASPAMTLNVYSHLMRDELGRPGVEADNRFRTGKRSGKVVPFPKSQQASE